MTRPADPPFEDIFGDGLLADVGTTEPAPLDPAEIFADTPGVAVGAHVDSGSRRARFDGDASELPPEACWALQELVAAPHISDRTNRHWPVVLQYEDQLRSRLSELGLVLEVNREHRYAFTRQADDPSPHSRAILRTRTLSLAASALALYLYQLYVTSPDDPVVETADMLAAIIKPVKGTSRYIIYGVITSILTAEQVGALRDKYVAIARGETADASSAEHEEDADA
jgi:hypothetical protein